MSDRSAPDDEPTDARPEGNGESDATADEAAEEWRFGIDEVGEDAEPDRTIEPGSPSAENAAFVLLGVLFALFLVYRTTAVIAV